MNYQNKVAVITGAASGIGRGLAERCALEKMFIVLADVNREGLEETSRILSSKGARHIVVPTDIADANQVDVLAKKTLDAFGQVDVVFNNAGVLLTGRSWELTEQDWDWVININLKGVINGIRTFTPIMLAQDTPGHIVNTASPAGLLVAPFMGPYTVTKHGVLALSETLHYELAALNAKIQVHTYCPLNVVTKIMDSGKSYREQRTEETVRPNELKHFDEAVSSSINAGISPLESAAYVFDAMLNGRYWVFTDKSVLEHYRTKADGVISESNPVFNFIG